MFHRTVSSVQRRISSSVLSTSSCSTTTTSVTIAASTGLTVPSLFHVPSSFPSPFVTSALSHQHFSSTTHATTTSTSSSTTPSSDSNGTLSTVSLYPRITSILRTKIGSQHSQWARRNGYIPGMVYGGEKKNIVLTYSKEEDLRKELLTRRTSFLNTLFEIEIDGKIEKVLPRDVQLHPFKPKIISVNWIRYIPGRYPGTKLEIPLKSINDERCPALREGGWLLEVVQKVSVFAHGPSIPPYLYMDLRGKQKGEKILASELELPPGIVLRAVQRDFAVAKLLGSKRGPEEQDETATSETDKAKETKPAAAASTPAAAAKPAAKAPAPAPAKA